MRSHSVGGGHQVLGVGALPVGDLGLDVLDGELGPHALVLEDAFGDLVADLRVALGQSLVIPGLDDRLDLVGRSSGAQDGGAFHDGEHPLEGSDEFVGLLELADRIVGLDDARLDSLAVEPVGELDEMLCSTFDPVPVVDGLLGPALTVLAHVADGIEGFFLRIFTLLVGLDVEHLDDGEAVQVVDLGEECPVPLAEDEGHDAGDVLVAPGEEAVTQLGVETLELLRAADGADVIVELLGVRIVLLVLVALAVAHVVKGLLELKDLHSVVQPLLGSPGIVAGVLAEVEGVEVGALIAPKAVAERVGVGVDVFPAPSVGVCCRGILGRGRSCSG